MMYSKMRRWVIVNYKCLSIKRNLNQNDFYTSSSLILKTAKLSVRLKKIYYKDKLKYSGFKLKTARI